MKLSPETVSPFGKNWLKGDFSVALKFRLNGGPDKLVNACHFAVGEGKFTVAHADDKVLDFSNNEGRDNGVVVVVLVELGQGPEPMIAASVAVRLYMIEDYLLSIARYGEGFVTAAQGVDKSLEFIYVAFGPLDL